jgi:putative MFS transporter
MSANPTRVEPPESAVDPRYLRLLLAFLGAATFLEGYDFFAITQVLPSLREEFQLSPAGVGLLVSGINAGSLIAYVVVRRGDRWGRRRVLTVTIVGYSMFSFLSAFALNALAFGALQMVARVFLVAEWATSMIIAAEEFPKERRGFAIGIVSACAGLGSIICAGTTPLLLGTRFGWRAVYLAAFPPTVMLALWRRGLRETRRFVATGPAQQRSLLAIWRTPHRRRVVELGLIWFLAYICTQNAITFWKEFAIRERGLSNAQIGLAMTAAAAVAMPVVFWAGKAVDRFGRRRSAIAIFSTTAIGAFGAYTAHGYALLTLSLALGVIGVNAVLTVMNAFTTELFPTAYRADAFAWSNNLLGRVSYWLSPLAVGVSAHAWGWGVTLRSSAVFPLLALVLILARLPETRGKALEETSTLAS